MFTRDFSGVWEESRVPPFSELIISWNGKRPQDGVVDIFGSFLVGREWTKMIPYASWGAGVQRSYDAAIGSQIFSRWCRAILLGTKATGFRVEVTKPLKVHVFTDEEKPEEMPSEYHAVHLPLRGISQMALNHPRSRDLCSPTCVTSVVRYLSQADVDPIQMADRVLDQGFNIFGNWALNVAESSHHLGPRWNVWVERLKGFGELHSKLSQGLPVVVSVIGPLEGGALPYTGGHLMIVIGYDPERQEVICVDSAFESHEKTEVRYKLADFLKAWGSRDNAAYLFDTNKENVLS